MESVAAQEYLAQDLERLMPVRRLERTKDKVSRAYWLRPFFESGQVLFPAKHLREDPDLWRALEEELIVLPSAEHDDLFDALQTAMVVAMEESRLVAHWLGGEPDEEDLFQPWYARSRTWRIPSVR